MVANWSGMRIIALPLTTRVPCSCRISSGVLPLTYYHFQTKTPEVDDKKNLNIVKRAASKAVATWASFGKAPGDNWKRKVFVYGEKLVDRIDFEELSLKGIDPSFGPRVEQWRRGEPEKDKSLLKIPLFYPPSADLETPSPLPHMRKVLANRTPHHRKGFYTWLFIAPLTAPLALIPIVPNLPFFYAAWRAWSHYRAWKAAEYLQNLVDSNHVIPQPSSELDGVYASYTSPQKTTEAKIDYMPSKADSNSSGCASTPYQPHLLLSGDAIPKIIAIFKLPDSAGADILRAIEQAKIRINKL